MTTDHVTSWPEFLRPTDLAPGDRGARRPLWGRLSLAVVASATDPHFEVGYRLLHSEFAARGELEGREVLQRRLAWDGRHPVRGCSLHYRMMLLLQGEECVAVRDHTAIMRAERLETVVHLSHALVMPPWRRQGLSAILRALPLQSARECAAAVGRRENGTTLVAEMEPWNVAHSHAVARMSAYEQSGFLKVDPRVDYLQPDFRSFAAIDASGGPRLIPLELLVRRIGRDDERAMPAAELQHVVRCLYEMYAVECRPADMRPCFERLERIGEHGRSSYALLLPRANGGTPSC
jgi:hypothetical protein